MFVRTVDGSKWIAVERIEKSPAAGRALAYEANGFVSAALIAIWVFHRAFVAPEGGMECLGFNTREAPDESHDAACQGKGEHC
jgi:hypothetical protein